MTPLLYSIWRMRCFLTSGCLAIALIATSFPALASLLNHQNQIQATVRHQDTDLDFQVFLEQLRDKRWVFVGETHDRYDHHLTQLAILKGLYEQSPKIAIGVEWFQQAFQPAIDDWLAANISEDELLRRSGYYERWRYDYRMLRPVMEFAKAHQLPVIALNAPTELTRKVAASGLASLSSEERAQLPETIHPADPVYRAKLEKIFQQHQRDKKQFERFVTVQRIWEETMASHAVRFLNDHPNYRMIILAGSGHMSYGKGIPADVARQQPDDAMVVVLSSDPGKVEVEQADYFVQTQLHSLPPTGKLGVWLDQQAQGLMIKRLIEKGAAAQAGVRSGDQITHLNDQPIQTMADLLLGLSRFFPGDAVSIRVKRQNQQGKKQSFDINIKLQ
ncbi:MAG: hypothetical protein CR991_08680 [Proteobacteria bacterium]|nr:MAG: hypothetical protein CR991_08680 [Pseudomonadota bacterium]